MADPRIAKIAATLNAATAAARITIRGQLDSIGDDAVAVLRDGCPPGCSPPTQFPVVEHGDPVGAVIAETILSSPSATRCDDGTGG